MFEKYKRLFVIITAFLLAGSAMGQQDPQFSQYYFNRQVINPAYAGVWETTSFMALARNQWTGWNGAPRTYTLSLQSPLDNQKVALGLNIVGDYVGKEKRFGLWGDYVYRVRLSETTDMRMGLKAGFTSYSNNLTEYRLSPGVNDPSFQVDLNSRFLPNFGMGFFIHNEHYFLGFSIPKVIDNDLKDDEYSNFSGQAEARHFYLEGGALLKIDKDLLFKPGIMFKAVAEAPVQIDLSASFLLSEKIWLGAIYRSFDAFGVTAQWLLGTDMKLGYAYDYPVSKLGRHNFGTHEVMVAYSLKSSQRRIRKMNYF
jgi:type IX secretion system PorP/SprF family membrane protein